jgi:hypothetical protein
MAYLKCFGVGVLMALAGAFAWLVYMLVEVSRNIPPEVRRGGVAIDIRGLFDNRSLLVVLGFFMVGFFVEFLILKRGLLHSR